MVSNIFIVNKLTSEWFYSCFIPCFDVFFVGSKRVSTCWSSSEKNHVLVNMCLIPFKNVLLQQSACYLKVVSTTFLLLCFLSLKESTCETRKNVFYFTSKAPSVLEKIIV